MITKTLFSILLFSTIVSTAFSQKVFFKYYNGKLYTTQQRDSIARAGNIILYQDTTQVADATIYSFYFYNRALTYSAFAKKYNNTELPQIKLHALDGKLINTDSLKGKVVMINFWSTTCAPCIAEMPQMNELVRTYSKDVVFLGIALENDRKVRALLKKFPFDFIVLANAEKIFEQLGVEGYPKNFFVDKQGIIRQIEEGTPVETGKDGKIVKEDGKWKVLVYKNYSKIIDQLLAGD